MPSLNGVLYRIRRVVRRVQRFTQSRALIIVYHRVSSQSIDPWRLSVTPANFEAHLQYLTRTCNVVSLRAIDRYRKEGQFPRNCVAVTFDDGYADNLTHAKPLLEKYKVPATVFVTTNAIDREEDFWWDQLATLILTPNELPPLIKTEVLGEIRFAKSDRGSIGRRNVHTLLYDAIRPLEPSCRQRVLDKLAKNICVETDWKSRNPTLTTRQLQSLAGNELIEIGGHTMNHPALSAYSIAEQSAEIIGCRAFLEKTLDREVDLFAYPYGSLSDFTEQTVNLVHDAGFSIACSAVDDIVLTISSCLTLPRFSVTNSDSQTFASFIDSWQ